MPLGTEVGLSPDHIVLDGDPAPSLPLFIQPMSIAAKRIKMPLGVEVGLGHNHIVLDGDPASTTERGTAAPPPLLRLMDGRMQASVHPYNPRTMSIVAKRSPISATAELL